VSNIVQAAYFTQIDETPAHELSRNIREAFGKALNSESEIDPDVLTMVGMSVGKYQHFINNLIRGLRKLSRGGLLDRIDPVLGDQPQPCACHRH
jgi:hypothetical protein